MIRSVTSRTLESLARFPLSLLTMKSERPLPGTKGEEKGNYFFAAALVSLFAVESHTSSARRGCACLHHLPLRETGELSYAAGQERGLSVWSPVPSDENLCDPCSVYSCISFSEIRPLLVMKLICFMRERLFHCSLFSFTFHTPG